MAPKPGRSKKRSSMAASLAYAARRAERRSRRDGERAKDEKLPSVGGATGSVRPEEPPAALKHQVPSIGSGTECVAKLSPDTTNNFAKAIPPPAPIVSTTTAPPDLPSSKESPHTDVSGDVADLVPPTPPATEIRAEKPSPAAAPAGTSSLAAKHEHSVSTPGTQDNEKSNVGKVVVSGQTGLTSTEPQEPHSEPMPSGATFHPSQSELTQAAGTPKREVGEKEGLPVVRRSPRLQTGNQVSPWVDNLRKERPWDRAVRETRENVIVIDDANDGDDDVDDIPSSGFGSEIAVKLAQVQDGNPKFFSVCNPTTKMFTSILGMREILLLVNGKMLNEDLVDWYCSVMTVRYPVDRSKVRVMSCAISQLIMRDDRSFNADRVLQAHLDPDERKEVPWKTIFEYERIIFPVCHGKHFVVVEIDPQERYVSLYDSTQGMSPTPGPTASVVKTRFKRYVEVQAKECGALASDFQYEFTIGLPMQQNGFDCGLYAIERIAVLLGAPAPRLATYSGGVAVMRAEMLRDFIKAAYEALWPATN